MISRSLATGIFFLVLSLWMAILASGHRTDGSKVWVPLLVGLIFLAIGIIGLIGGSK